MKLHVNTSDLSRALKAVVPHASDERDMPEYNCVQFHATWDNVYVSATNRVTAGLGLVSIWEREGLTGSQADDYFTLSVDVVKALLRFFKAKSKPENELDDQLSIEVTEKAITVTDVSGLFPGKSVSWPNPKSVDNAPNLLRLFSNRMTSEVQTPTRIITQGKFLKLFATAAAAYGEALTVEPATGDRSLMLTCGESFLGLLMQVNVEAGDEFDEKLAAWRDAWKDRLPEVALAIEDANMQEAA